MLVLPPLVKELIVSFMVLSCTNARQIALQKICVFAVLLRDTIRQWHRFRSPTVKGLRSDIATSSELAYGFRANHTIATENVGQS